MFLIRLLTMHQFHIYHTIESKNYTLISAQPISYVIAFDSQDIVMIF